MEERDKMTEEEAIDWAEYNIFNAYIGDSTPVWAEDGKKNKLFAFIWWYERKALLASTNNKTFTTMTIQLQSIGGASLKQRYCT